MTKNIIAALIFIFASSAMFSQDITSSENTTFNSQFATLEKYVETPIIQTSMPQFEGYWTFGGSLGLSFWNGGTDILIGPKAYYNFSPKFLSGFGLTYIYSEHNTYNYDYHSNSFGGSVMIAYRPFPFIQVSTEYEGLQTNYSGYYSDEYFLSALYLGISYVTGPVSFGLRYDLLYDENKSVYGAALSPVVGFYF